MGSLADPTVLTGRWRWHRVIDDRLAQERSTVAGTLDLTPDGDGGLDWVEAGRWGRSSGVVEVRRSLRIRPLEDGWWVLFEDGRRFHPWRPGEQVVHPCGADSYRGSVTGTARAWRIRWDVQGPAKAYSMTSTMSRAVTRDVTGPVPPGVEVSGAAGPGLATPAAAHRRRAGS